MNYENDILIKNILIQMEKESLTQQQLADILGMSQSNISKALSLNVKQYFTLDQVVGLSNHFKISIDELLGIKSNNYTSISPRSTASFIADLLENKDAEFTTFSREEEIFDVNWDEYSQEPTFNHYKSQVQYHAFFLPSYWDVPVAITNEKEEEIFSVASQVGNETRMKPVNDFIKYFNEINSVYKSGGLSKDTYDVVISDMLGKLRD